MHLYVSLRTQQYILSKLICHWFPQHECIVIYFEDYLRLCRSLWCCQDQLCKLLSQPAGKLANAKTNSQAFDCNSLIKGEYNGNSAGLFFKLTAYVELSC